MLDERSRLKLSEVHQDLQKIIIYVSDKCKIDLVISEGYRSKEKQLEYFNSGKSKVKFGKHNEYPSMAVDIYPTNWKNDNESLKQLYFITGVIKGVADTLGIKIRQGHDWNGNNDVRDDKWIDAFHVELI